MTTGSTSELLAQLAVEIFVYNLNSSLEFYSQVGFKLERRSDTFAVIRWDESYLFLDERPDRKPISNTPAANVRVIVENVDKVWECAKAIGAHVESPLTTQVYGLRDFTILDPDGFGVRFAEIL